MEGYFRDIHARALCRHGPDEIRAGIDKVLSDSFDEQEQQIRDLQELRFFTDMLRDLLAAGGKRIRPVLYVTGCQPLPFALTHRFVTEAARHLTSDA